MAIILLLTLFLSPPLLAEMISILFNGRPITKEDVDFFISSIYVLKLIVATHLLGDLLIGVYFGLVRIRESIKTMHTD